MVLASNAKEKGFDINLKKKKKTGWLLFSATQKKTQMVHIMGPSCVHNREANSGAPPPLLPHVSPEMGAPFGGGDENTDEGHDSVAMIRKGAWV